MDLREVIRLSAKKRKREEKGSDGPRPPKSWDSHPFFEASNRPATPLDFPYPRPRTATTGPLSRRPDSSSYPTWHPTWPEDSDTPYSDKKQKPRKRRDYPSSLGHAISSSNSYNTE